MEGDSMRLAMSNESQEVQARAHGRRMLLLGNDNGRGFSRFGTPVRISQPHNGHR